MVLTGDDVRRVYAQGEAAVVALVVGLSQQVTVLAEQVSAQALEITELKERLNKNSRNSNKPPSSDGLGRKTASSREPSGRRSGGQPGHPGRTLAMAETADRVVAHAPRTCPGCQGSLAGIEGRVADRRQVFELPEKLHEVIEHQVLEVTCPQCQGTAQGEFPEGVTQPVQYGPGLKGLMVYLQTYQLLPYERTAELIADVFGLGISEGTLDTAKQTCAQGLAGIEASIKTAITAADVVGFDETGSRIDGKTQWLHTASTPTLTLYETHTKRGTVAMDAIGILPAIEGTAVHDGLPAYFRYDCRHGLCNAHHVRELKGIAEQGGQVWATDMRALLVKIKVAVDDAKEQGAVELDAAVRQRFTKRYRALIVSGRRANPIPMQPAKRGRLKRSPASNLLNRLDENQDAVLLFMHDFRVPFDNNLSERDLRMMKVKQKVSGCFRSAQGAADFCRIRGYISTLRKQNLPVLSALRSVFSGNPLAPTLA